MKTQVYINGTGSISRLDSNNEVKDSIIEPNYKDLIPAKNLRRMSKVMRMNNFSALMALKQADVEFPEAINVATGYGCLTDTEKFLSTLLDNDEKFSNPSAFINSTHNTLAGNLAILIGAKGQNFTFVHPENSFENALIDACIGIEEGSFANALVGGVDEKTEILETVCSRENLGEGASFVHISKNKDKTSLAEISAIKVDNSNKGLREVINVFLKEENLKIDAIDLVITNDSELEEITTVNYEDISGVYPTATAFACVLATNIIATQTIPTSVLKKSIIIKNILIVSNYSKRRKSLILLKSI